MPTQLTAEDAKQSLNAHVAVKGAEIFEKYGPRIGWRELQQILNDRAFVRYPCEITFDAAPLGPGEFAHPVAKGEDPEAGFTMFVHPWFMTQLDRAVYLVLYQLVVVNYGQFATSDDAETFGSEALGLNKEGYYKTLCAMSDELGGCGCS
ncbi:MAG: hypothetical protein C5B50_22850 [Verrucomicrobia bacterium]|nr:MAG: hypothetical protein C5B50_22850 [Verrucomicrobiota bacterium]